MDVNIKIDKLNAKYNQKYSYINSKANLAVCLDYLMKEVPMLKKFNVVRMHGIYRDKFYEFKTMNSPYMALNIRTIYCVKNVDALLGKASECTKEVEEK